jgi:hypothetical protein
MKMIELLPKLIPVKGFPSVESGSSHPSLVDIRYLSSDPDTNGPTLRCGISIANIGKGPLHIILGDIEEGEEGKIAPAKQRIFNDSGEYREVDVGYFEYHLSVDHIHWHYDGLASLDLFDNTDQWVGKYEKDSHCVVDVFKYENLPESPTTRKFLAEYCNTKTEVGISVGWADWYKGFSELQYIRLENIRTGIYYLRFKVNETKLITEIGEPVVLKINIDKENNKVTILE